jgi:ankyrin repeat protein
MLCSCCVDKLPNLIQDGRNGETPLHAACKRGNIEVVELLLSREDLACGLRDKCGQTALYLAIPGRLIVAW